MGFSSITNMGGFMQMTYLRGLWSQKRNNPGLDAKKQEDSWTITNGHGTFVIQKPDNDNMLTSITAKLEMGQALSPSDLIYLRNHAPDQYAKAMKLAEEKRRYEEELSRCKTKDEVRALHTSKLAGALSHIKIGMEQNNMPYCVEANSKMDACNKVYGDFKQSKEYEELAENHKELAEAIDDEKGELSQKRIKERDQKRQAEEALRDLEQAERQSAAPETVEQPADGRQVSPGRPEDGKPQAPAEGPKKQDITPAQKAARRKIAAALEAESNWEPKKKVRTRPAPVRKPRKPLEAAGSLLSVKV